MFVALRCGIQRFYINSVNNACCYILCHLTEEWKERLKSETILKYFRNFKAL